MHRFLHVGVQDDSGRNIPAPAMTSWGAWPARTKALRLDPVFIRRDIVSISFLALLVLFRFFRGDFDLLGR
jgi:hypothetical protein